MATKRNTSLALFLLLNLIFFSLVSAWAPRSPNLSTPRSPKPYIPRCPPLGNPPSPQPGTPPGNPPSPPPGTPPQPGTPPGNPPSPPPGNPPSPPPGNSCPRDALQLGVCANALGGLLNLTIGQPPVEPCCSLIEGLVDLEAAICLCTVIRASILGININLPIVLTLLLNVCSREVPRNFVCA